MEFFDKVKEAASDFATSAGRKSKELYAVAKLKMEITDKQNTVKNLYKEVGFEAYSAYKADSDILEAIKGKLEKIDVLEDKIADIRKKIVDVKNAEMVGVYDEPQSDEEASDAEIVEEEEDETEKTI